MFRRCRCFWNIRFNAEARRETPSKCRVCHCSSGEETAKPKLAAHFIGVVIVGKRMQAVLAAEQEMIKIDEEVGKRFQAESGANSEEYCG
jgi:hypothetical protein